MLYIVLLHFPVYNTKGQVITTAIINMDIHDIARVAAKTHGASGFYIVNPIDQQRMLAQEIVSYWRDGLGASYNPSRQEACGTIRLKRSLTEALADIEVETGKKHRQPLRVLALRARLTVWN